MVLVVGPEGGVADDELAAFEAAGALSCRLGPTVLRTSTAGTAAVAVVMAAQRPLGLNRRPRPRRRLPAMDGCLFCGIVAGEIPASVVHETERTPGVP